MPVKAPLYPYVARHNPDSAVVCLYSHLPRNVDFASQSGPSPVAAWSPSLGPGLQLPFSVSVIRALLMWAPVELWATR